MHMLFGVFHLLCGIDQILNRCRVEVLFQIRAWVKHLIKLPEGTDADFDGLLFSVIYQTAEIPSRGLFLTHNSL